MPKVDTKNPRLGSWVSSPAWRRRVSDSRAVLRGTWNSLARPPSRTGLPAGYSPLVVRVRTRSTMASDVHPGAVGLMAPGYRVRVERGVNCGTGPAEPDGSGHRDGGRVEAQLCRESARTSRLRIRECDLRGHQLQR